MSLVLAPVGDREGVPEYVYKILDAWLHGKELDLEGQTVPVPVAKVLGEHFLGSEHCKGDCINRGKSGDEHDNE